VKQLFIVLLKFSANRNLASQFMHEHNAWIQHGFDDGVILLAGGLRSLGGCLLADNTTLEALQQRLARDPFVAENVVTAEILELTPNQADERMVFLLSSGRK
jgi:uncharacterized protein YciI